MSDLDKILVGIPTDQIRQIKECFEEKSEDRLAKNIKIGKMIKYMTYAVVIIALLILVGKVVLMLNQLNAM